MPSANCGDRPLRGAKCHFCHADDQTGGALDTIAQTSGSFVTWLGQRSRRRVQRRVTRSFGHLLRGP